MTRPKRDALHRAAANWAGAAGLLLLTAACRRDLLPQPVPLDRVSCARCAMLVSDGATAAEAVFADSDPIFYDDVGCLASADIVARAPFELWVEVDGGTSWKKAREAYYARPAAGRTPMGYGLYAFSTPEKARAHDQDGRVRTWQEVQRDSRSRAPGAKKAAGW